MLWRVGLRKQCFPDVPGVLCQSVWALTKLVTKVVSEDSSEIRMAKEVGGVMKRAPGMSRKPIFTTCWLNKCGFSDVKWDSGWWGLAHSWYSVSVHFHFYVNCLYVLQLPYPWSGTSSTNSLWLTGLCFRQATCDYSALSAFISFSPKLLSRKEPSWCSGATHSEGTHCPHLLTVAWLLLTWVFLALGKERVHYLKLPSPMVQSTPAAEVKEKVVSGLGF